MSTKADIFKSCRDDIFVADNMINVLRAVGTQPYNVDVVSFRKNFEMNCEHILIRKATVNDIPLIHKLYVAVSKTKGGLARTEDEITEAYIRSFVQKSTQNGVQYIAVDELQNNQVIAEMHCYKLEPKVFEHVLSELTIVVDSAYQGRGIGKTLFQTLLNHVKENREDICRVELIARESNIKAIQLYESLGFEVEGRLQGRIKNDENQLEADIPMAWFNPRFKSF